MREITNGDCGLNANGKNNVSFQTIYNVMAGFDSEEIRKNYFGSPSTIRKHAVKSAKAMNKTDVKTHIMGTFSFNFNGMSIAVQMVLYKIDNGYKISMRDVKTGYSIVMYWLSCYNGVWTMRGQFADGCTASQHSALCGAISGITQNRIAYEIENGAVETETAETLESLTNRELYNKSRCNWCEYRWFRDADGNDVETTFKKAKNGYTAVLSNWCDGTYDIYEKIDGRWYFVESKNWYADAETDETTIEKEHNSYRFLMKEDELLADLTEYMDTHELTYEHRQKIDGWLKYDGTAFFWAVFDLCGILQFKAIYSYYDRLVNLYDRDQTNRDCVAFRAKVKDVLSKHYLAA